MKIRNMLTGEYLAADFDNGFLHIAKLHYSGEFCHSENGRFILSWSDADPEGLCDGYREKGHGRYLLIDGDNIILQGKLERPNDGKVSDQGIFVINDWMFGEGLKNTFYAFDTIGKKIIQHKVTANLDKPGISTDGRYAACQTYYSDTEDGNKIFFFDLVRKELVWKCEPKTGRPDDYYFDIENKILHLLYKTGGDYQYSFDGEFLDSEKWEQEYQKTSNGYELFNIAVEKKQHLEPGNADSPSYDEIISLMKKALDRGVSEYYQALIHRELGEIYQRQGRIYEAIHHFEKAISLNPKIGLKKAVKILKEELSRR